MEKKKSKTNEEQILEAFQNVDLTKVTPIQTCNISENPYEYSFFYSEKYHESQKKYSQFRKNFQVVYRSKTK